MSDQPESSKAQLEVLEANLLEELSANFKPTTFFQQDFLSQLPVEIAHRIIGYLAPCDLMVCAGVSRTWQRLGEDDRTWRQKCFEKGYMKFDAPSSRFLGGWAANRAIERPEIVVFPHMGLQEADLNRRGREIAYGHDRHGSRCTCGRSGSFQIGDPGQFKQALILRVTIRSNVYKFTLIGSLLVVLVIRCGSGMLIWNAQLAFTLTGHTTPVWAWQVSEDGKYIVSGSRSRKVRVWCGQTGVQLHVLRRHTDRVRCMSLHRTTLVSGSRDQTIRVWDIVDGKCLRILTGHWAQVSCVQFDGERVVSASCDSTVKVWNVHTGECLHTLTGHTEPVKSLFFEPERELVVSDNSRTIRVWDLRRGTGNSLLDRYQYIYRMELRENRLACCDSISPHVVWDIRDGGSCIHHLRGANGHTSPVSAIHWLESGLLVTASYDGSVKLWDVDKGIFVRDLLCLQNSIAPRDYITYLKATETLLVCVSGRRDRNAVLLDFDASYP